MVKDFHHSTARSGLKTCDMVARGVSIAARGPKALRFIANLPWGSEAPHHFPSAPQAYPEHIESKELIKQLKAHFSSL